ncbi:phage portal protein [Facklamia hominis]|uniref:phage portal protein n=1 Tax=Facklamia hominis TaxID=178214 RepID=UPI00288B7ADE|nr:phage portal protein [Facklamia hominis]
MNTEGHYIPKSYRFERGIEETERGRRVDSLQFDAESNTHFVYHDMNELIDTANGQSVLKAMLDRFFYAQKERLSILDHYSKGENYTVLSGRRRIENEKSDYRVTHNWGAYISNYITGYLLSLPVTIGTKDPDDNEDEALEELNQINDANDVDSLNFELGFDTSRFGRAYELHYRDEEGRDHITLIDPQEIFVIRSADVSKKIIGAVHVPIYNDSVYMTVYTDDSIIKYKPYRQGQFVFAEESRQRHFYGLTPVVEWQNNRFRQGDFETVISLIDAYDSAQSDTANYMSDLNDALLVINGDLQSNSLTVDDVQKMKEANMLVLESGMDINGKQTTLSAEYIYKQYDVTGTEAYKTRLMNDIYKLSNVPNLDDDRFYSGQSGVALQYKMIGLEQVRSIKEAFYTKALKRRYQLIENIHSELSMNGIRSSDLTFTFHTNIPQDVWAEVEKYISAGGEVSQTTLMELASFIENIDNEKVRLENDSLPSNATDQLKAFMLNKQGDADGQAAE